MQRQVRAGSKRSLIVTATVIIINFVSSIQAAETAQNDLLMNTLPQDCMVCLRINNFNESLGKLDSYLAGASPIPMSLAMVVNMQLGAMIGDPMLSGIDMKGDFAAFAVMPDESQTKPSVGVLVPIDNYTEFVTTNPNCKQIEDSLTLLVSPNSQVGNLLLTAAGEKYALVVPETEKATLPSLQKALANEAKLSKRLSPAQANEATTAPVWGFVDIAGLYAKYNQQATAMLGMAQQGMTATAGPAEMMEFQFKMLSEMFKEFGNDLDSATLSLAPESTVLSMDMGLRAKDNSELAKMLTATAQTNGYELISYLDDNNAVNGLVKMNKQAMQA
jgi:hypothetical protein